MPWMNYKTIYLKIAPKSTNIIVCGDFNLPHTSWPEGNAAPGSNSDKKSIISNLQEFSQNFFMAQIISEQTHRWKCIGPCTDKQ